MYIDARNSGLSWFVFHDPDKLVFSLVQILVTNLSARLLPRRLKAECTIPYYDEVLTMAQENPSRSKARRYLH